MAKKKKTTKKPSGKPVPVKKRPVTRQPTYHELQVQEAMQAINFVHCDTTVDAATVRNSLLVLRDEITMCLESIEEGDLENE